MKDNNKTQYGIIEYLNNNSVKIIDRNYYTNIIKRRLKYKVLLKKEVMNKVVYMKGISNESLLYPEATVTNEIINYNEWIEEMLNSIDFR